MDTLFTAPAENQRLDVGISPGMDPEMATLWFDGLDVVFRDGEVRAVRGDGLMFSVTYPVRLLAQAYVTSAYDAKVKARRIYYVLENGGLFSRTETKVADLYTHKVIADLNDSPVVSMATFGNWLAYTNNDGVFALWKNAGAPVDLTAAVGSNVSIVRQLGPHLIAFGIDDAPDSSRFCSADDPEDWDINDPANSAGELTLRDLGSAIVAVEELGQDLAVYAKDCMGVYRYLGAPFYFGFKRQLVTIGAVGRNAVVSTKALNYGFSRSSVWVTDGTSARYIDLPQVRDFIQQDVDWTKAEQIVGYHDEEAKMVKWSYVNKDNAPRWIGYGYDNGAWARGTKAWGGAVPKDVFDTPIIGDWTGLRRVATEPLADVDSVLISKVASFDDVEVYKRVSELRVGRVLAEGGSLYVEFHAGDTPDLLTAYAAERLTTTRVVTPIEREAPYFQFVFTGRGFRITGLKVRGWHGGSVVG